MDFSKELSDGLITSFIETTINLSSKFIKLASSVDTTSEKTKSFNSELSISKSKLFFVKNSETKISFDISLEI